MAGTDNEVRMMMSVYPGAMTGFAALNAGLVSINNVFGSMTRSIDAQFGLINTAIITTGVVVGQLGLDAMDAFGKFEQGMKIVQMVSGQTSQDINYLKKQANELSVSYRTDIDQLTEGLQTLGRAGLNSASEQTEVLKNGLNTAKLEGRDLNGVLEELIQNTALLGGNLKSNDFGEQSQYVNDLLVATSMTAPITTHDVSETLKYSGGIAAAAGANIESEDGKRILEDYMGSIAAFAQKGVTGSIAGTALRAFFNKPATQDSSVIEALGSINLKPEYLWEDDEDVMKPVSEQIEIIKKQMDKLNVSTMDRLQIWSKIVGGKMGQQMMKLDSDDIKSLTKDIRNADDATNLAQKSMRTYESNVKAIGEAGERMKRNVGEDLVTIVNPYLTIFSKILEFANNDAMSWPITFTIMAVIAATARRIKAVISMLKTEITTLWADFRQGLNYFTQKGGVVRKGENPISKDKSKSEKTSSSKSNEIKNISRMTLSEYDKYLSQKTQPLTISDYKKMGINDSNLAMMARMQRLTKDSLGIGISDKEFANVIGKTGVLTKEQQQQFNKLLAGTNAARGPFDTMFGKGSLNPVIAKQISENSLAIREFEKLGVTLTDLGIIDESVIKTTQQQISTAQQYANTLKTLTDEKIKTGQQFVQQTNAFKEKFLSSVNSMYTQAEEKATATTQINAEKEAKQIETEKTGATEEIKINQEKQSNILSQVTLGSQEIVGAVSTAVAETKAAVTSGFGMPGYYHNFAGGLKPQTIPLGGFSSYSNQGILVGGIAGKAHQLANEAALILEQRILGNIGFPLTKDIYPNKPYYTPPFKSGSITGGGAPPIPEGVTYGPNQLLLLPEAEVTKHPPVPNSVGVGSLPYLVPSLWGTDTLTRQDRRSGPENVNLGSGLEAKIEEEKRVALQNVQYGEAELEAHREGVLAEQEIYMMRRQAADTASQNAHQRASSTEKDRVKFQEDRNKSNLITSRKEIDDIRRQAAADRNKAQRELSTERDRQKFQEERSKSNMVSQREAERFRNDALKKSGYVQENQKFSKSFSNQMNNIGLVNQSLGKFANQVSSSSSLNQKTAQILSENKNVLDRIQSNPRIVGTGYSNTQDWKNYNAGYGLVGSPNFQPKGAISTLAGGAFDSLRQKWRSDRAGRFNFGTKMVNGELQSVTKGLRGMGNGLLNMTDIIGGPVMLAFMAIPAIIGIVQGAFEGFCQDLKKAQDQVSDAFGEVEKAEDALRETYKDGNPDATADDIDQMVYDTYSTMAEDMNKAVKNGSDEFFKKLNLDAAKEKELEYDEEKDDGSLKEVDEEEKSADEEYQEAVKENTGALYQATAQLNVAIEKLSTKMTDSWWGMDSTSTWLTDQWGGFWDKAMKGDEFGRPEGSRFSDEGEFLLTQSQADENYPGYTEAAGLMLEDFKDANGDWIKGLRQAMGKDIDDLANLIPQGAKDWMQSIANNKTGVASITPKTNAKIQTSLKNDPKTWKKLAREYAKRDMNKKAGRSTEKNVNRIKGLTKKLADEVGHGFNKSIAKQTAYLVQMQEMLNVAQNTMVPLIGENTRLAGNQLLTQAGIHSSTDNTAANAGGTWGTAQVISGLVAIIAKTSARESAFQTAQEADPNSTDLNGDGYDSTDKAIIELAQRSKDANEFAQEANKDFYKAQSAIGKSDEEKRKMQAPALFQSQVYEAAAKMTGYDYNAKDANDYAQQAVNNLKDEHGVVKQSLSDIYNTFGKNYTENPVFQQRLIDNYLNATEDDDSGSGGGGGGGGGGSGSGDKDKDTGTKKERVDLVLCNKKEIPKLNVNLFKKPPTFTVLNKNFKLRDVKINTEDKPKAIMSSIKNAFIDVQKRTDPKIIQDEEAEYDPAGATDGNALPSGSSKPKTT